MTSKLLNKISAYIKDNEGLRLKPYLCSAGKMTIGYGRNLDGMGISRVEANMLLTNDLARCLDELVEIFGLDFYKMPENVQQVLVDMIFNLGKPSFLQFKKMIAAVKAEVYGLASREIRDSRYARVDVPDRAHYNAWLMDDGKEI